MYQILFFFMSATIYADWSIVDSSNSPMVGHEGIDLHRDAEGTLYIHQGRKILTYKNGQWGSIEMDGKDSILDGKILVEGDGTMWIGSYSSGLYKISEMNIFHFDSTNSCLYENAPFPWGNVVTPLGVDAEGNLVLSMEHQSGLGGVTYGFMRFNEMECIPIPDNGIIMGRGSQWGLSAYSRDSLGNEYIATKCISDASCGIEGGGIFKMQPDGITKLVPGPYWPWVAASLHSGHDVTYFGLGRAFGAIHRDRSETIETIDEKYLHTVLSVFMDSRNTLWVGTEGGYDFYKYEIGLIRIAGSDTLVINKDNSGFPGYTARSIVEDEFGRIWMATRTNGIAVYSYDGVSETKTPKAGRPMAKGRQLHPGKTRSILGRFLKEKPGSRKIIVKKDNLFICQK